MGQPRPPAPASRRQECRRPRASTMADRASTMPEPEYILGHSGRERSRSRIRGGPRGGGGGPPPAERGGPPWHAGPRPRQRRCRDARRRAGRRIRIGRRHRSQSRGHRGRQGTGPDGRPPKPCAIGDRGAEYQEVRLTLHEKAAITSCGTEFAKKCFGEIRSNPHHRARRRTWDATSSSRWLSSLQAISPSIGWTEPSLASPGRTPSS